MINHTELTTETYRVDDASNVTLQVTIGEAQPGTWEILWDADAVVARGTEPEIVSLGAGRELRGRTLQVVVVADAESGTNRLSRTLILDGGPDGRTHLVARWDDGTRGDRAEFSTMIGFL